MIKDMRMREKVAVAIILCMCIVMVMMVFAYKGLEKKMVEEIEIKEELSQLHSVYKYLIREEDGLDTINLDWSTWDVAYDYMLNKNKNFEKENLTDDSLKNLKINLLLYINNDYKIVSGQFYKDGVVTKVTGDEFDGQLAFVKRVLYSDEFRKKLTSENSVKGLVGLEDANCPLIITANPVRRSDGLGKPAGWLIMGRYLDDNVIKSLSGDGINAISFEFFEPNAMSGNSVNEKYKKVISDSVFSCLYNFESSSEKVKGSIFIKDIFSDKSIVVNVELLRGNFVEFLKTLKWFGYLLIAQLILVMVAIFIILNRMFLRRLEESERLSLDILREVDEKGYSSGRIEIGGSDELSAITETINDLNSKLAEKSTGKDILN